MVTADEQSFAEQRERHGSIIGQSDAVDVAAEVVEEFLGRAERLFSIDDPGFLVQCFEHELEG